MLTPFLSADLSAVALSTPNSLLRNFAIAWRELPLWSCIARIASIVARMQGDLVLPELNEDFDEVLVRVDDGEEETMDGVGSSEAVLERVWSLSLEDT